MAYMCEICGKKTVHGRSQQHRRGVAGKRWRKRAQSTKRVFRPNLQKKTLIAADGGKQKILLCSKCIKRIKNFGSIKTFKNVSLA